MERRKSKLLVLTGTHKKKDREEFFLDFCNFIKFFLDFGSIFAVRCLRITDFVSFPFCTHSVHYVTGTNEYEILPLV